MNNTATTINTEKTNSVKIDSTTAYTGQVVEWGVIYKKKNVTVKGTIARILGEKATVVLAKGEAMLIKPLKNLKPSTYRKAVEGIKLVNVSSYNESDEVGTGHKPFVALIAKEGKNIIKVEGKGEKISITAAPDEAEKKVTGTELKSLVQEIKDFGVLNGVPDLKVNEFVLFEVFARPYNFNLKAYIDKRRKGKSCFNCISVEDCHGYYVGKHHANWEACKFHKTAEAIGLLVEETDAKKVEVVKEVKADTDVKVEAVKEVVAEKEVKADTDVKVEAVKEVVAEKEVKAEVKVDKKAKKSTKNVKLINEDKKSDVEASGPGKAASLKMKESKKEEEKEPKSVGLGAIPLRPQFGPSKRPSELIKAQKEKSAKKASSPSK